MSTSPIRAIVIAGGEMRTIPHVGPSDYVVAADSGYDHAVEFDITVDLLVGDLDSISHSGLAHALKLGVEIDEYPSDKDDTDLELAMRAAIASGASSVAIHGGEGGRLAHLLGIALSTSHQGLAEVDVAWHTDTGIVRAATPQRSVTLSADVGETITLLPVGDAHGVTTSGLRWPLAGATLDRGATRGVSNVAMKDQIHIEVGEGAVLVIQEGTIPT
jgi:thiamine pyrophosphokinase